MKIEMEIRIERYKKYRTLVPITEDEIEIYTVQKVDEYVLDSQNQKNLSEQEADRIRKILLREEKALKSNHTLDKNYKKILFGEENIETWQEKITEIRFSGVIPEESMIKTSGTDICADISEEKDGSVIGWVEQIDNGAEYILHINAEGKIYAPTDSTDLFQKFSQTKKIEFGDVFNTKNVTNMWGMFSFCENLSELDISTFNTKNVTNMWGMFSHCEKLNILDVSKFDTANVTNMGYMFNYCGNLRLLDVSGFDTHNVKEMDSMFWACKNLETLDLSRFHTENVTDMHDMFAFCSNLKVLDVSGFNTRKVTDMKRMFKGCGNLKVLDLSSFDVQNVKIKNFEDMFSGCISLKTTSVADLLKQSKTVGHERVVSQEPAVDQELSVRQKDTDTQTVSSEQENRKNVKHTLTEDYKKILFGEENIESWQEKITEIRFSGMIPAESIIKTSGTDICADISEGKDGSVIGWVEQIGDRAEYILHIDANGKIQAPENSSALFRGFVQVHKIEFGDILDTSQVTDMSNMFFFCEKLKSLDVSYFNTQNVTNMEEMFGSCKHLKTLDVSGFCTENVVSMAFMFRDCVQLTVLDVSGFDTHNVTDMRAMFLNCDNLKLLDVSEFDTHNVTDMGSMFFSCKSVKTLDVSGFDTSNVTDMYAMFWDCERLESLDVSGFDTRNVISMEEMFWNCKNLKKLDVSGFDIRNVTDMENMFEGCDNLPSSAKKFGKKGVFGTLKNWLRGK